MDFFYWFFSITEEQSILDQASILSIKLSIVLEIVLNMAGEKKAEVQDNSTVEKNRKAGIF